MLAVGYLDTLTRAQGIDDLDDDARHATLTATIEILLGTGTAGGRPGRRRQRGTRSGPHRPAEQVGQS
jgi:hypothetical protein